MWGVTGEEGASGGSWEKRVKSAESFREGQMIKSEKKPGFKRPGLYNSRITFNGDEETSS